MSVSTNRAVCAHRLVQEKLCNLLFNNQQKCVTLTSKRNLSQGIALFPPSTQSSPFMRINQHNNKFGSFIRHSQVSLTLYRKLPKFRRKFLFCCITKKRHFDECFCFQILRTTDKKFKDACVCEMLTNNYSLWVKSDRTFNANHCHVCAR
jgi:hypothetical protein